MTFISNKNIMKKLVWDDIQKIVWLHKSRNVTYIELYKKFFMWVMDRQIDLDRKKETIWQANISSPVTYMLCMAVYWMYQDSKVAFEIYKIIKKAKWESITDEEQKETETISNAMIDLFENIYEKSDGSEEFDMSVLDAIILGNGFWWIWYEQSESTYEVIWKDWKKEIIEEKISMPNIYRIIPLNFYTEVSAPTQQKAKFNIIRKIKTATNINKDYKIYWVKYTKRENKWIILEWKDRNMVFRFLMFNNMVWVTTTKALWINDSYSWNNWTRFDWQKHTDIRTDNSYKIWEDLHEVYEVHTDTTIQVFVDWEDLWLFKRLWPRKIKPFYKLSFRDWLNWLYDMWVGLIAYQYHKVVDAFLNMRIDNDRLLWSQPLIANSDETAFDWQDVLERYPWKIVKVRDINESLKSLNISTNWANVANSEVDMLWATIQDAVWVSWYKLWVQQKVERSARWVQELVEAADAAMKSFIDSIAKTKWFISKYIVLLSLYYMDDETLDKMSWFVWLKEKINITDFINDYSFNFDIQSVSSLRERQEVDSLKDFLRDYQWVTRPDWTPVLDIDVAIQELIEKKRLNSALYMSPDKAKEYMQQQIWNNAEMQQQEAWSIPWAEMEWIVPMPWVPEPGEMWMAPMPGVQWWSAWASAPQVTNPLWTNQETWVTLM